MATEFNLFSVYDLHHGDILEEEFFPPESRPQEQSVFGNGFLDYLQHNAESPLLETCLEEIAEHQRTSGEVKEIVGKDPNLAPFSESPIKNCEQLPEGTTVLSTMDILRAATKKCALAPTDATSNGSLQLVELLIVVAEKIGCRKFDEARVWMDYFDQCSSDSGNPVERLVFHFSSALRERIHQDAALSSRVPINSFVMRFAVDLEEAMMSFSSPILAIHQNIPFCQVQELCAMQTIEEHAVTARRIHIIDLAIRSGVHWPALMQGLAGRHEYPIQHLRITAVGSLAKEFLDETGNRLQLFARELELSFSFRVVMLSDAKIFREDLFDVEEDERVFVLSNFALRTWISCPDRLQSVMAAIKKVNPCIMVVSEIESTFASTSLTDRLEEALLYFGAFMDSLEDCLGGNNRDRMLVEQLFLKKEISNVIAEEGKNEKAFRDVKEKGWGEFIARFGMVEVDISDACIYLGEQVKSNFEHGSSCMLAKNGKSLTIGWKGTPMHFFSAWKFSQDHDLVHHHEWEH